MDTKSSLFENLCDRDKTSVLEELSDHKKVHFISLTNAKDKASIATGDVEIACSAFKIATKSDDASPSEVLSSAKKLSSARSALALANLDLAIETCAYNSVAKLFDENSEALSFMERVTNGSSSYDFDYESVFLVADAFNFARGSSAQLIVREGDDDSVSASAH